MRVLYLSLIIIIADQVSKFFVKGFSIPFLHINHTGMVPGERIRIIGDFFRLTYIENPGMAFGIDPGIDYKLLLSIFSLAASFALLFYLYYSRSSSKSLRIALAFIFGGAAGNLIDRMFYGVIYHYAPLFYGKVVDFLDFDFFDVNIFGRSYDRWPIFNFADSAVTIGVLILILFYKHHQNENETLNTAAPEITTFSEPEADSGDIVKLPDENTNAIDTNEEKLKENNLNNGEPDKGKEIPL